MTLFASAACLFYFLGESGPPTQSHPKAASPSPRSGRSVQLADAASRARGEERLKVQAPAQPGTTKVLRGKGVPRCDAGGRGRLGEGTEDRCTVSGWAFIAGSSQVFFVDRFCWCRMLQH